jgi:hypothetical protein
MSTSLGQKAFDSPAGNFAALVTGIRHSGQVRISFPLERPYDAECGVAATAFGTRKHP